MLVVREGTDPSSANNVLWSNNQAGPVLVSKGRVSRVRQYSACLVYLLFPFVVVNPVEWNIHLLLYRFGVSFLLYCFLYRELFFFPM